MGTMGDTHSLGITCAECDGRGYHDCPDCNFEGSYCEDGRGYPLGCWCHGTGIVQCYECKGAGEVVKKLTKTTERESD